MKIKTLNQPHMEGDSLVPRSLVQLQDLLVLIVRKEADILLMLLRFLT